MLDTSILGELTADACAAVTGREDAAALLRSIDRASLFLVPLDDQGEWFRFGTFAAYIATLGAAPAATNAALLV